MWTVLRSVVAIVLGALTAMGVFLAFEGCNVLLFPLPAGLDPNDIPGMNAFIAGLPPRAFLLLLVGYACGTFCGAAVAAWVARSARLAHGVFLGVLFMGAGVMNFSQYAHRLWVVVLGLGLFLPAACAGAWCVLRGRPSRMPVAA